MTEKIPLRTQKKLTDCPLYRQAAAKARAFIAQLGQWLDEHQHSYKLGVRQDQLAEIDGTDISIQATPALFGDVPQPDGETFTVRIWGPQPDRAILYGHNHKGGEAGAVNTYRRLVKFVGNAKKGRPVARPMIKAAQERTLAVANAFGCKATYNCGQAKIQLPGGAVAHVSGERDHSVHIDHLNDRQLRIVLDAIAATTKC